MAKEKEKTKCPSCDSPIGADSKHCSNCGAKIKDDEPPGDDKGEELVSRGVKRAFKEMHEEAKKKGKSPLGFLFGD